MSNKICKKVKTRGGGEECIIILQYFVVLNISQVQSFAVGSHQSTWSEPSADSGLAVHPVEWDDEPVMTAAAGVNGHLTALGCKVGGLLMK